MFLHGQASFMAYRLNTHELDFGDVHYDRFATKTLTLTNSGLVPLDFNVFNLNLLNQDPHAAQIEVHPESGVCAAMSSTILTVKFTPNLPESIDKILFLQVSHFQPDQIRLLGTGMFCRLELNVPRYLIQNSAEEKLLQQVSTDNNDVQSQLDTMIVKDFLEKSSEPGSSTFDLVQQMQLLRASQTSLTTSSSTTSLKRTPNSVRVAPILPDYVVDFEYVILGTVQQKTIEIRNPTTHSITFQFDRSAYRNTGFSFDCDRFKNLPPSEVISIKVTFDPRGANLGLGEIECRVPVEVRHFIFNFETRIKNFFFRLHRVPFFIYD